MGSVLELSAFKMAASESVMKELNSWLLALMQSNGGPPPPNAGLQDPKPAFFSGIMTHSVISNWRAEGVAPCKYARRPRFLLVHVQNFYLDFHIRIDVAAQMAID